MQKLNYTIQVNQLCKHFDHKIAVNNISLKIKTGEIFGFLGPNGSGKTTTIRMLCGLLTPNGGTGHCLGYDILTESEKIKKHTGYMTQKFSLYEDLSVYENLNFIASIYNMSQRKTRIQQTLDKLDLTKRQKQLAGNLSGGWKQRLALAAAILHEPKLLLLDEPTAGVDPKARREFWDHLHNLSTQGITTLVSTHYMDEAERCHRLAYIASGRLLTEGTADSITQHSGLAVYAITSEQLYSLAEQLKNQPGITQINRLGNFLRVCGTNKTLLTDSLKKIQHRSAIQWSPVYPTLEEVFISLSQSPIDRYYDEQHDD